MCRAWPIKHHTTYCLEYASTRDTCVRTHTSTSLVYMYISRARARLALALVLAPRISDDTGSVGVSDVYFNVMAAYNSASPSEASEGAASSSPMMNGSAPTGATAGSGASASFFGQ